MAEIFLFLDPFWMSSLGAFPNWRISPPPPHPRYKRISLKTNEIALIRVVLLRRRTIGECLTNRFDRRLYIFLLSFDFSFDYKIFDFSTFSFSFLSVTFCFIGSGVPLRSFHHREELYRRNPRARVHYLTSHKKLRYD